jgi:predicted NACHT family NTPase
MLPNADRLMQLMKQQVDALVLAPQTLDSVVATSATLVSVQHSGNEYSDAALEERQGHSPDSLTQGNGTSAVKLNSGITTSDQTLRSFFGWVRQKSLEVKTPYKPAAVRAFYLMLALPPNHRLSRDQALALAIDRKLAGEQGGELALDLALIQALGVALAITPELVYDRFTALHLALDLDHLIKAKVIGGSLKQLKNQLPGQHEDREGLKQWWQHKGQAWTLQLRDLMIQYRNIGQEWHFGEPLQHLLEQYGNANKLLVDCLSSNCQLTPAVRQEIEEKLLLPM